MAAAHSQPESDGVPVNPREDKTDDPSAVPVVWISIISVLTVIVAVLALQAFYFYYEDKLWQEKVVSEPYDNLDTTDAALKSLRVLDTKSKTIHLPIELAMELQAQAIDNQQAQTQPNHD